MPHHFDDDSIGSSLTMVFDKPTYWVNRFINYGQMTARVDEVLYTDDPRNSTYTTDSKQVEYVCTILGGPNVGQKIFNVKSTVPFGGINNTGEVIHTANISEDASNARSKTPSQTHGSIVIISFLHGSMEAPIITGCLHHPRSTSTATKADGERSVFKMNGMSFAISKDGELTVTFGGGPVGANGQPANAATAGSKIKFNKSGSVQISDKDGNGMTVDPASQTVSMNGTVMSLGGGGMGAARLNDPVFGTDSQGGPITAYIGAGSSTVLIGG